MVMGILEIIKGRRSIRDFKDKEIPEDVIDALTEAIRWAPSAGNLQSRKFYFIFNKDIKRRLAEAALNQSFIARAPLTVVACTDQRIVFRYGERGVSLYSVQDVSASIENMLLTAYELGLGSVWVGAFMEEEVKEVLKLPGNLRPVAIIPIGYPARIPKPPSRMSKDEAIEFVR
jgi:nitroreductase